MSRSKTKGLFLVALLTGGAGVLPAAGAEAATVRFQHWSNTGWYSSSNSAQPGMTAFAQSIVKELQTIAARPDINYDISQPFTGDFTGCTAPDLCITFSDVLSDNKGGDTLCKANPTSGTNYSRVYARTLKNMAWTLDDGMYFGPSYGQLLKNAVLHELGHQMGICTDYTGSGSVMCGIIDKSNTAWKVPDKDAIYRWFNPPSTGICSGNCVVPKPGTPTSPVVTIPTNPDALMCDGASGAWEACRGSGCWVCREKITTYPLYLSNHPNCHPNDTCAGEFYTCSNNCPAPTSADLCSGTAGQWGGCRGNGCSVCTELVSAYPNYFKRHPACASNGTCGGKYYTCNSNCPAPTNADK